MRDDGRLMRRLVQFKYHRMKCRGRRMGDGWIVRGGNTSTGAALQVKTDRKARRYACLVLSACDDAAQ